MKMSALAYDFDRQGNLIARPLRSQSTSRLPKRPGSKPQRPTPRDLHLDRSRDDRITPFGRATDLFR